MRSGAAQLINYANEALQAQFNADVFAADAADAAAEGIDIGAAVPYADNAACVALLDGRGPPPGLLCLLNEECALGDGSDANFLLKLTQSHRSNPSLRIPAAAAHVGRAGGMPLGAPSVSFKRGGKRHVPPPGMFSPARRHRTTNELLRTGGGHLPQRSCFAVRHYAGEVPAARGRTRATNKGLPATN